MKKINLTITIWSLLFFSSCSNSVDFGEQYEKIVYIVNSKEIIYYAPHEPIEESRGSISFYCSGTKEPDEDIHIRYKIDSEALAEYNKNEFGDKTDRYFVLYVLPVSIESAGDYEIHAAGRLMLYSLRIQNEYAGDYNSIYEVNGEKTPIEKKAIALSRNQILLPLAGNDNDASYEDGHYRIQIEEDNTVTFWPYMNSEIELRTVSGTKTNYYNPDNRTFYLYYNIFDQWGDPIPIQETLIKM